MQDARVFGPALWGGFHPEDAQVIEDLRRGDYVSDLWRGNLGYQVNDESLQLLAESKAAVYAARYLDIMEQLADAFRTRAADCSPILVPRILSDLSEAGIRGQRNQHD